MNFYSVSLTQSAVLLAFRLTEVILIHQIRLMMIPHTSYLNIERTQIHKTSKLWPFDSRYVVYFIQHTNSFLSFPTDHLFQILSTPFYVDYVGRLNRPFFSSCIYLRILSSVSLLHLCFVFVTDFILTWVKIFPSRINPGRINRRIFIKPVDSCNRRPPSAETGGFSAIPYPPRNFQRRSAPRDWMAYR